MTRPRGPAWCSDTGIPRRWRRSASGDQTGAGGGACSREARTAQPMAGMKISVDAAMRARDVSAARPEDEAAAERADSAAVRADAGAVRTGAAAERAAPPGDPISPLARRTLRQAGGPVLPISGHQLARSAMPLRLRRDRDQDPGCREGLPGRDSEAGRPNRPGRPHKASPRTELGRRQTRSKIPTAMPGLRQPGSGLARTSRRQHAGAPAAVSAASSATGHRPAAGRHRAPGTGHRAPGTGHRAPGTGHRAPGTGHKLT